LLEVKRFRGITVKGNILGIIILMKKLVENVLNITTKPIRNA